MSEDEDWYRQMTTIDDAIEDGLQVNIDELMKLTPDPEVFDQEYRCRFSAEYGSFIDISFLDFYFQNFDKGSYYCGIDFGRKNDSTVVTVLKTSNGKTYLENIVVMENTPYQEQFETIESLHKKYHFTAGYSDCNGIGSAIAEQIQKQICSMIKGFTTTSANKTPMYEWCRS